MSLAEKSKEHIKECFKESNWKFAQMTMEQRLEEAFYAGAEAALKETDDDTYDEGALRIEAEIDHFRSHK